MAAGSDAVVLDRIAVIVGKHVIKTSDIDVDLRLTAFLNREAVRSDAGNKQEIKPKGKTHKDPRGHTVSASSLMLERAVLLHR